MALILNIDTSSDYASIALSINGSPIQLMKNPEVRDHASWIHQAIHELLIKCGHTLQHLDAVAVAAGPGSYTGLRIGMSTAKGLCYVLDIPLITVNTLKMMAVANSQLATVNGKVMNEKAIGNSQLEAGNGEHESLRSLLVPMIDARRMEVYIAIFDVELNELSAPEAMILTADSLSQWKQGHKLYIFGSGSNKFKSIVSDEHFMFGEADYDAGDLGVLSYQAFCDKKFADLAYAEPFYLKEFFSTGKK